MLKLLDIPDSWFATFMFKRSLDAAANKMSQQAYMQGKLLWHTIYFLFYLGYYKITYRLITKYELQV